MPSEGTELRAPESLGYAVVSVSAWPLVITTCLWNVLPKPQIYLDSAVDLAPNRHYEGTMRQ